MILVYCHLRVNPGFRNDEWRDHIQNMNNSVIRCLNNQEEELELIKFSYRMTGQFFFEEEYIG